VAPRRRASGWARADSERSCYILIWRERNVDATIVITGRLGIVSAFDLAPLAHRQEARIRAALR
jgi:hypothetical protein